MTIYALLLAVVAFVGGWFIRRSSAAAPIEQGLSGGTAAPAEQKAARTSAFAAALVPGNYVAIAEIHRFAALREQIGYLLSDQLLTQVTAEIEQSLNNCTLGRVGRKSVEFVFAAASDEEAASRLEILSRTIESKLEIDGCHIGLITHVGAVRISASVDELTDVLLDKAESALCEAQESKRRAIVDGAKEGLAAPAPTFIAIRDIPRAIAGGELKLAYQPKLHCRSDKIHSIEALLRWHHPVHGPVKTQELINAAEATGAIRDLTKWVIEQAASDQRKLDAAGIEVSIDVNISGSLICSPIFTRWALAILTSPVRPMGIEITETAVIEEPEQAIANLKTFADAGVRIAIDDYGAGLSSLAYLKQLPAHELKIDRGFISGLIDSHRDPLIIRSTIDLAHALEMEVTAEGVDDPMAFGLLRAMGCDIIQGYLIAQPIAFDELVIFLTNWRGSEHHTPQQLLGQGQLRRQN